VRDAESRFAHPIRPAGVAGLALAFVSLSFLLLLMGGVRPAEAAFIHEPASTFPLQDSTQSARSVAIDEEEEILYVLNGNGGLEKFDLEGNPLSWEVLVGKGGGPNELQQLRWQGFVAGDDITLTCPNGETTESIEWVTDNATRNGNIKAALEAKCGPSFNVTGFTTFGSVTFEGPFAQTNVPRMTCTVVNGTGSCPIVAERNGSVDKYALSLNCGSSCYQLAIDNTGGPNQGIIYVSSTNSLTTCCPNSQTLPSPQGGIHPYFPSGESTHSTFEGKPIDPNPFDAIPPPPPAESHGGIYIRSQSANAVAACGVAVDENGDLYVAHGDSNLEYAYIDKLDIDSWSANPEQEPELLGTMYADTSSPCKSQVDSQGFLYSQRGQSPFNSGHIRKRDPSLFHEPLVTGPIPAELRDPSSSAHEGPDVGFSFDADDNLYALRPEGSPPRVQKLDPAGSVTETFGSGEIIRPGDIAVNKGSGSVYVVDAPFEQFFEQALKDLYIYEALPVPDSLTGDFEPVSESSGTVDGEARLEEPGEEVTGCEFEYTTRSSFNSQEFGSATAVPCEESTPFTADEPVGAEFSGLTLEQEYVFRLVTENSNGVSNGTVRNFVPHAVVGLTTKAASNVAPRSATLNASFQGTGDATEYWFEYGNANGAPGVYPNKTAVQMIGSPNGLEDISLPVSGLELESTYHYRVVAKDSEGIESKGFDGEFKTKPAVEALTTKPASEIGQDEVVLDASYIGTGHGTDYYFEYGPTKAYGLVSETFNEGATTGLTNVSAPITEYYGYTTYHYRVVAENSFGETVGKDMTFTTLEAPLPDISETSVVSVTPTTATLSAQITPNRWDASWFFEWGESTEYEGLTELEDVLTGNNTGSQPIEATIEGLKPATFYHFRTVAFNFTGVTNGPDLTFLTPDVPKVESSSSSDVTADSARLSALVTPNSSPTTVRFEYGTSTGYGATTGSTPIGTGTLAKSSAADLAGLAAGTTYHYRVVAENEWGTSYGKDETFTTAPGPEAGGPPSASCARLLQLSRKNGNAAKQLRKKAAKAKSAKRKRKLNRRASGKAKKARSLRERANACSGGGAGK
jgi:hypothetical protein